MLDNMFDLLFQHLTPWHWFIIGAVLMLVDVLLGSFFFLWIGLSAAIVGTIGWLWPTALSNNLQLALFALLTCISLLIWRKVAFKHQKNHEKISPLVNLRTQQYIGKQFTVFAAIENGRGKIQIGDSTWLVEGEDCPVGTIVVVTAVDGTVLKVKKLA